jgi:hypothetical protein
MTDIVERLRGTLLDKDNFPRMDSEKWLPVGLAKEAADEIERLRAALIELNETVEDYADADDGQPNLAMRIMVMVRAAIEKSPPAATG